MNAKDQKERSEDEKIQESMIQKERKRERETKWKMGCKVKEWKEKKGKEGVKEVKERHAKREASVRRDVKRASGGEKKKGRFDRMKLRRAEGEREIESQCNSNLHRSFMSPLMSLTSFSVPKPCVL